MLFILLVLLCWNRTGLQPNRTSSHLILRSFAIVKFKEAFWECPRRHWYDMWDMTMHWTLIRVGCSTVINPHGNHYCICDYGSTAPQNLRREQGLAWLIIYAVYYYTIYACDIWKDFLIAREIIYWMPSWNTRGYSSLYACRVIGVLISTA